MNALHDQIRAARRAVDVATNPREISAAWQTLHRLQTEARNIFARERGWRPWPRRIDLRQLKAGRWVKLHDYQTYDPPMDHDEGFVVGPRPGFPVAMLSHSYAPWERCKAFAERHGLDAELLPFSWYMPGRTIAVVYTRPE